MKKDIKKRVVHRLKIIEGQVKGLQRMAEEEEYCISIITQVSAMRQALSSVEDLMLENHLLTHVVSQMKSEKGQKKAVEEMLSIYKLSKKK
ncbi:MAG: metal-sensitive transcriptional regulator [Patescibacteria group bacterium UBA2103]